MSRAKKHRVVNQWVTRTKAEWRAGEVVARTAAVELGTQAISPTREWYQYFSHWHAAHLDIIVISARLLIYAAGSPVEAG